MLIRSPYYSSCLFPCLQPRDGIHRLASFDAAATAVCSADPGEVGRHHEMRSGIALSFPDALFSVSDETESVNSLKGVADKKTTENTARDNDALLLDDELEEERSHSEYTRLRE